MGKDRTNTEKGAGVNEQESCVCGGGGLKGAGRIGHKTKRDPP